jgi:hypothetical protein
VVTFAQDRVVLREWRDRHSDVHPTQGWQVCVRLVWLDERVHAGQCGEMASWVARGRPLCERHTVERINQWVELEREVSA